MELSPGSKENRALEFAQCKFLLTDVSCRGTEASPSLFLINKGLSSRAKGAQVPGEECDSQDPLWIIFRFCPPHTHTHRQESCGVTGSSGQLFSLCIVRLLQLTPNTEMPPSQLHSPSLDSVHESNLVLFRGWDILFPEKEWRASDKVTWVK